jgi:butyryl-CoA dehydrogenase
MTFDFTQDQLAFREAAARFAREEVLPRAAAIDEDDVFPRDLVLRAGELGFTGIAVPVEHSGAGRDHIAAALALEEIARASATVSVILAVSNALVADTILVSGTDEQRTRWLPRLAAGKTLGAFALSEERAGTDAFNQHTRVALDGVGYRLNGRKVWVANAEAADVAVVFAASQPGTRGRGISAFLVPLDADGIVRTTRNDSLGVRGLGCLDLEFRDVYVDSSQMLGSLGGGMKVARRALDAGRVAIAAQAIGVGQAALDEAIAYAKGRETFGQPIATYQAVQWMLADTATELDAARLLTYAAAAAQDTQPRFGLEASMAKLYASEAAHRAADRAMQILASAGYRRGSRVERLFRDARATEIYQGTSEVQRMIIAEQVLGL